MHGLAVLGATGTIGLNTLDVAARHPERFRILALSAHRDVARMVELCLRHRPAYAVMGDAAGAEALQAQLRGPLPGTEVLYGAAALAAVVALPEVTQVMAGIVGAAGLLPTLAAVRAGKRVLLANKEPLVMAGRLFMHELAHGNATLIPVDSEHNAIFQCLPAGYRCGMRPSGVRRIILTASGGPFRELPLAQLRGVTPEQAVRHPNWVMGRKISVDSATMMNKGLELIEAAWLFALPPERLEVMLHPQSLVHSLVEFDDGSQLAQLGQPDMRVPIANALAWPERIESGAATLDLAGAGRLDFAALDAMRYPCLDLARQALSAGGDAPAVLNAANEVAVEAFLEHRIAFTAIPEVIDRCLDALPRAPRGASDELQRILAVDAWARQEAEVQLTNLQKRPLHA
ncbi:MAG TPA: 1-deoxy-D-xylulose-5-phosphate reductoisomerase [Nevskiales bacterium]|nr:1-deoxy-D-xylulose-5-phosphate reductoisomerase [Nevskiales bacterium]